MSEPLSSISDEATSQEDRAVLSVPIHHTERLPEATTKDARKYSAKLTASAYEELSETDIEDDPELSETDIEDMLLTEEDVVSFEIQLKKKIIDVGLLKEIKSTRSRIESLFDQSYTVTFFQGHIGTTQHCTANMLRTRFWTNKNKREEYVASAGVYVYETPPELPIPPRPSPKVYVSTVAHLWSCGVPPSNVAVKCCGRLNVLAMNQIAKCRYPDKECSEDLKDQSTMLCNITNGDGPRRIPSTLCHRYGIDICLIPLLNDKSVAMGMLLERSVSSLSIEDQWGKDTPVFVVYGQYAEPGLDGLHVLEATITRSRCGEKMTEGYYCRVIEYELKVPNSYTSQNGDSGSPLFTVVKGQVKLLGFHIGSFPGTASYYAVPARRNLHPRVIPIPAGYSRKICIPAELMNKLKERA